MVSPVNRCRMYFTDATLYKHTIIYIIYGELFVPVKAGAHERLKTPATAFINVGGYKRPHAVFGDASSVRRRRENRYQTNLILNAAFIVADAPQTPVCWLRAARLRCE